MRILHVIQEMRLGGAERVVASLVAGARRAGHDVAVAAAPGPLAAELGVSMHPLPVLQRRAWRVPGASLKLGRALKAFEPDVVHAHNPGMAVVTAVATRRGARTPALVSVHGSADEDYPKVARLLRRSGLAAVACGSGVAEALREQNCRVVATIPNAVPPPPAPADRTRLEERWGIAPGRRRLVVSVGRLVPAKGLEVAIEAIARVPDAVLVVLGDGPLRGALETHALERGVADRLVLPGERSDARAIMAAADAVLITSRSEGLPLVVLEAMVSGTPLVAAGIRGIREVVEHERSGLIVPPGDASATGEALERVLADTELARKLAAGAAQTTTGYGEDDMVGAFLDLYRSMVSP